MRMLSKKLSVLSLSLVFSKTALANTSTVGWAGGFADQASYHNYQQTWQVFYTEEYENHLGFDLAYLNEGLLIKIIVTD